jgi:hypothetical protein
MICELDGKRKELALDSGRTEHTGLEVTIGDYRPANFIAFRSRNAII